MIKQTVKMNLNRWLILSFFILFTNLIFAQRNYDIAIPAVPMEIENCYFQIEQIQDLRIDTSKIGIVRKGAFNTIADGTLSSSLPETLNNLFSQVLKTESDYTPLVMVIHEFYIHETDVKGSEQYVLNSNIQFLHEGEIVFTYENVNFRRAQNALNKHGENIFLALEMCLQELSKVLYDKGLYSDLPFKYSSKKESQSREEYDYGISEEKSPVSIEDRNVTALGYQIGGWNLIGFDYEIRATDVIGFHFGAGFRGFTVGTKLHLRDEKKAPFFNASYKDGGFGLIKTAGVEYGGTVFSLNKNSDLDLIAQIGIQGILEIDSQFENTLFGAQDAPDAMISIGIGLSW